MVAAPSQVVPLDAAIEAMPADGAHAGWLRLSITLPGILWTLLWLAISSSPWVLTQIPHSALEKVHYYRALGPLVALGLGGLILLARAGGQWGVSPFPWVLRPWLWFAVLATLACATSPNREFAVYWALAYLAAIVVLWSVVDAPTAEERLARARSLNFQSWAIAVALLLSLLWISGGALFMASGSGFTGYGLTNRVTSFAGLSMVRATGLARCAAVPAMFTFVLAWRSTGIRRVLWGCVAVACASIVLLMQSRGSTLGLFAGLGFALLLMGQRARYFGTFLLACVLVILFFGVDLGFDTDRAIRYLARKEAGGSFDVSTGRTRDWGIAWDKIMESPFWGWGPQADRFFFHFHVHNTYLYAWLAAGVMGALAVALGILRMWRLLARAVTTDAPLSTRQRTLLVQVGCLLAYFTIRGIPEVSGAMFGVDLLLMLPAMAWLDALNEVRHEQTLAEEALAEESVS